MWRAAVKLTGIVCSSSSHSSTHRYCNRLAGSGDSSEGNCARTRFAGNKLCSHDVALSLSYSVTLYRLGEDAKETLWCQTQTWKNGTWKGRVSGFTGRRELLNWRSVLCTVSPEVVFDKKGAQMKGVG